MVIARNRAFSYKKIFWDACIFMPGKHQGLFGFENLNGSALSHRFMTCITPTLCISYQNNDLFILVNMGACKIKSYLQSNK